MVLHSEGLEKSIGKVCALHQIHLTVGPSSGLAILGPSGAGKSTLLRCLAGLETPTRGSVLWDGVNVARIPRGERRKVQLVMQDSALSFAHWMNVETLWSEPLRIHGKSLDAPSRELLEHIGISSDKRHVPAMELSGGERQRLALGRALLLQPEVLLLDECFSGLDRRTQAVLLTILFDQQRARGLSWIVVTHDRLLARHMTGEAIELEEGRMKKHGPSEQLCD